MSVCAKFRLSSWSRSGLKVPGGVVGCSVVGCGVVCRVGNSGGTREPSSQKQFGLAIFFVAMRY